MIDFMLYIGYALIGLAIVGSVVLPLIKSLDNPASLVKGALGIAGLIVIFLIGYVLSGSEVTPIYEQFNVDQSQSKLIGAALITMYLMGILAIASILYSEIVKLFK